ncbi:hypothetical protein PHYPO_G00144560 [Pangasianodon hypophthalmus]|uniref:Uncharacterized protein n=1 Tax=Pangasianodon hypophthalmus TaxID=310915 RepID=A0A5N5K4Q0_PANHP|nr:uncharacterized protein LOC113540837 [Pangasianodon hypophthalmus]KAB5525816.1 hypothetical protein PHYPO_G00144560 [Pangasianodon hypophthalmus]
MKLKLMLDSRQSETLQAAASSVARDLSPFKMPEDSKKLSFFLKLIGNTMNIHQEILRRLKQRLVLAQVSAEENSDVIIAFVPIVSRMGTDIEAALQNIPRTGKPVVLMVLHFTFDENHIAPRSQRIVNRDDVLAVDLLCYEDLGLLRSLHNDEALKAITDYLTSIGASPNTQLDSTRSPCGPLVLITCIILIVIVVATVIGVIFYLKPWQKHTAHRSLILP